MPAIDGSNIIVIVSFFEHIVALCANIGIINAIIIISFFIRCFSFFLGFRVLVPSIRFILFFVHCSSTPLPRCFAPPPPKGEFSPWGEYVRQDGREDTSRISKYLEIPENPHHPVGPPSAGGEPYHIDSNTAPRNVSLSFIAVAHASVHDDAHVVASEYDCRYIQYDVGPLSYP